MPNASPPISRFPVPRLEDLPEDVRARILAVQEKAGFIPNVFLALAHRPDEFRAFFDYHDALMAKEGGLSKGEREMIVVATSAANDCHYCVVAHGALVRVYEKKPLAMKVALRSAEVEEADYARLREHGFTDEDAWDIAGIAAFFGMSNRLANSIGMRPNDEFYLMGRVPRPAKK